MSGGGGGGTSSAQTTNTTNSYWDGRSVTDASTTITDNSDRRVDQSQTYLDGRSFYDTSDRRLSYSDSRDQRIDASVTDNSDRRLSLSDSSDRRVDNSVRVSTDGGAFDVVRGVADGVNRVALAQVDAARSIAAMGGGMGTEAARLAVLAQERAFDFNDAAAARSFNLASSSEAHAYEFAGDSLGFVRSGLDSVLSAARDVVRQSGANAQEAAAVASGAYQSAADTASGNKALIYAALGSVALVGVVAAFKR